MGMEIMVFHKYRVNSRQADTIELQLTDSFFLLRLLGALAVAALSLGTGVSLTGHTLAGYLIPANA